MKKTAFFLSGTLLLLFFLFLLYPDICLAGAENGLFLWGKLLVPVLLPFFILTGLIKHFFPFSDSPLFYLLMGLLSGYPIGASLVSKSNNPHIRSDFYLGLTNNPSPAFLLTCIGDRTLYLGNLRFAYYGIILLAILIGNLLANHFLTPVYPMKNETNACAPSISKANDIVDGVLENSITTILKIGAYVMFFSILARFFMSLFSRNALLQISLTGFLELTTGISLLRSCTLSMTQKIVLSAGLASFGGLCSVLQTQSVIRGSGLSMFNYIIRRLLCAGIAMLFTLFLF